MCQLLGLAHGTTPHQASRLSVLGRYNAILLVDATTKLISSSVHTLVMTIGSADSAENAGIAENQAAEVLARWHTLIVEYEAFRDALRDRTQQPHWPGVGPCIGTLRTEAATVERLLEARAQADRMASAAVDAKLAASNLSARETAWATIKKCRGVLALDRRFPKGEASRPRGCHGGGVHYSGGRTNGVFINAVVDDGHQWLRILTVTEAQLLMEMAESGWEWGADNADGEDDKDDGTDIDVSIVRTTLDLIQAAQANRFRGAPPRLCILLSRIDEGRSPDIDVLMRRLRQRASALGDTVGVAVAIHCANSPFHTAASPPLDVALIQLMPGNVGTPPPSSSSPPAPLNIDTSILIALASDITHSCVATEPWHPQQRMAEIAQEQKQPGGVLRRLLGDVLSGHRLVCTREASQALHDMTQMMGQSSEKARAAVLVGKSDATKDEKDSRLTQFRALSSYPDFIPDNFQLPIIIADEDWDTARIQRAVIDGSLPAAAGAVVHDMTSGIAPAAVPTLAVFFFGWAMRYTTITTNQAAKNRIERLLEQFRTSPDEDGPVVWVCRTVRSLNGTNPRRQVGES